MKKIIFPYQNPKLGREVICTWASMGPIPMGSIYSNTPPQSEQQAQRCSRLDKKRVQRANTPPQPQLATG
jgi:hypothetical protein